MNKEDCAYITFNEEIKYKMHIGYSYEKYKVIDGNIILRYFKIKKLL